MADRPEGGRRGRSSGGTRGGPRGRGRGRSHSAGSEGGRGASNGTALANGGGRGRGNVQRGGGGGGGQGRFGGRGGMGQFRGRGGGRGRPRGAKQKSAPDTKPEKAAQSYRPMGAALTVEEVRRTLSLRNASPCNLHGPALGQSNHCAISCGLHVSFQNIKSYSRLLATHHVMQLVSIVTANTTHPAHQPHCAGGCGHLPHLLLAETTLRAQIAADPLSQLAAANWAPAPGTMAKPPAFKPALVVDIYQKHLGGGSDKPPALKRVMLLELSQYLENYLWPHFSEEKASYEHVMSIVLLINEKFRENVPAWGIFEEDKVCNYKSKQFGTLMSITQTINTAFTSW